MNPRERKIQKIKEVYGSEFLDAMPEYKTKHIFTNDGWLMTGAFTPDDLAILEKRNLKFEKDASWQRPLDLTGIENNSSWILHEEYPLPEYPCTLVIDTDNGIDIMDYNPKVKDVEKLRTINAYQIIKQRHF